MASFVISSESITDYESMLAAYQSEFQPDGPHECFLVSQMAESRWRCLRFTRLENVLFEQALATEGSPDPDSAILANLASNGAGVLNLLARHRAAAEKSYYKAHKELTSSRERKTNVAATEVRREKAEAERDLMDYLMAPPPILRNEPNRARCAASGTSDIHVNSREFTANTGAPLRT